MKKLLIIDNYDSFTYNLVQYVQELTNEQPDVYRNDKITLKEIDAYDSIILSPGPGVPSEAGILLSLIKEYASTKKILGVCLGHQAIGEAFGASLLNLKDVFHGVATEMQHFNQDDPLYKNIPNKFMAGRYHSWVIEKTTLPEEFIINCTDEYDEIMGIRHRNLPVFGVQYHPESILTQNGKTILKNFLDY